MKSINTFFLFLLGIFMISLVVGCSSNTPTASSQNQPMIPNQPSVPGRQENNPPVPTGSPPGGYNNTFDRQVMMQNAIDACSGLNENDSCQVTFGNRTINATCRNFNNTLSCMPVSGGRMRGNYTRGNYTKYQNGSSNTGSGQ